MKYFRYLNGVTGMDRSEYLMYGLYASSKDAADAQLKLTLYQKDARPEETDPLMDVILEYLDERDLEPGENATELVDMFIPTDGVFGEDPWIRINF